MTEATLPQVIEKNNLPEVRFTEAEIQLIRNTLCPKATDEELGFFLAVCQRRRLDPFANQIHAVKRWNADAQREVLTIQTGIDGFRIIAERTGEYAGQEGPYWTADGINWVDVWISDEPPAAAKVGVKRKGFDETLWGIARFKAYAAKKKDGSYMHMWAEKGDVMIAKCAEALAFRKAFPNEFAGIYSNEEMQQADNPPMKTIKAAIKPPQPKAATAPPVEPEENGNGKHEPPNDQLKMIDTVTIKEGTNKNGPWKKYGIRVGDAWYTTFSETFGNEAIRAKDNKLPVVIEYKMDGEYATVTNLQVIE